MLYLMPFATALALSSFTNSNLPQSDKFYIYGEMRWFILFFTTPMLIFLFKDSLAKYRAVFIFILSLVALYSIYQAFSGIDFFRKAPYLADSVGGYWRAKGFFTSANTYAYSVSSLLLLILATIGLFSDDKPWQQTLTYICIILVSTSLLLTFTRGMWISFVLSILIMIYLSHRKYVLPAAFGIILFMFTLSNFDPIFKNRIMGIFDIGLTHYSDQSRIDIWAANWQIFKQNIFFGVGWRQSPSFLSAAYAQMGSQINQISHPHSNFMSVLSETGLFGFVSYVIMCGYYILLATQLWKSKNLNRTERALVLGVIGVLVNFHIGGMTEGTLIDAEVFHLFIISASILTFIRMQHQELKTT